MIGVITGLKFEADIIRKTADKEGHDAPLIASVAGNQQKSYQMAKSFVQQGAKGLVSFGIAGGLHPDAPVGALLLADQVVGDEGHVINVDKAWHKSLVGRLTLNDPLVSGPIISLPFPLETEAQKRAAFKEAGVIGVDMESFGVARAAKECAVPFLVIRSISDGVTDTLPASLVPAMGAEGQIMIGTLLANIMKNPGDIIHLPGFGLKTAKANQTLRRVCFLGLPFFGLDGGGFTG